MADTEVTLQITQAEAVVLFEFLSRYTETDQLQIHDQSEQQMLWNLLCVLERSGNPEWPSLENARSELRFENDNSDS